MMTVDDFDVLVLGAGAAGLAAAAELSQSGRTVCVVEARDRLGGRIWTRTEPHLPLPVELGAEFVHGEPPATLAWLRKARTVRVDAAHARWTLRAGELQPGDDLFDEMKRGFEAVRRPRKDMAFGDFLADSSRHALSPRAREFARMLVEGFDAADAARVSTLQTLEEWKGASAADAPTFRPLGGYITLIEALVGALDESRVHIRLGTVVRQVRWKRGEVRVDTVQDGQVLTFRARKAVVTLPLGVLQLAPDAPGAVRFEPALRARQPALAQLAAGPVIKVILWFRSAFWETLDGGRYADAGFFHAPDAPFPTFWSSLPLRSPMLTAWAAGPRAVRLAGLGESQIVPRALESLEALFGRRANVRAQLQAAYMHDWQADPFARGAYSYVTVGGTAARRKLAVPLQGTLFFGGEASDTEGESGTVAGALQSGVRAARELLGTRA